MTRLLHIVAVGEAATGLLLLLRPNVVRLLFAGEPVGVGITMTRIAGICLIALGVACWPDNSPRRPLFGMLTYSTPVMLYLIAVAVGGSATIFVWVAIALHALISVLLLRAILVEQNSKVKASTH